MQKVVSSISMNGGSKIALWIADMINEIRCVRSEITPKILKYVIEIFFKRTWYRWFNVDGYLSDVH